ncbi:MAG: bifunctional diguanylate cyclase/phosphodiesterase [Bacilli bacterium]|nr:bifunctional diguanylate cyclase/phosphodiesterase [Bacilli bacterium]
MILFSITNKYMKELIQDKNNTELVIKNFLEEISPYLGIGRVEVSINLLNKIYDLDLTNQIYVYDVENYSKKNYNFSMTIPPKGNININFNPDLDTIFSDDNVNRAETFLKMFFTTYINFKYQEYIQQSYNYDSTTGILNVLGLINEGVNISKRGKISEYVAIFLNIQDFKLLNMRFGMELANKLLRIFSNNLIKNIDNGEFVSRAGGDNFIVLIKKENVRDFIDSVTELEIEVKPKNKIILESRMGIYPIGLGDNITSSIENASIALNIAKKTKNNIIFFDHEMKSSIIKEKEIMSIFPSAIKDKEFEVYYQPKVDLISKKICGSEALVRWKKDCDFIPPSEFIPILEKENLICKLDYYILQAVCEDINKFINANIDPVKVSINFSKRNLRNPDFAKDILEILSIYSIDYKYIEIELTETTNPIDYKTMIDFVDEMRRNKIAVSIDDFGTGYSSINTIKDLDVEVVKIDKAFIDNIDKEKDKIVLKNIVRMIQDLNMDVIAEGVEKEEQTKILLEMGCSKVQGYYFDRPLEKKEYVKRLNKDYLYK